MSTDKLDEQINTQERLLRILESSDISKKEMAAKLGISAAHVTNLTLGKAQASQQLVKLIDELWPNEGQAADIRQKGASLKEGRKLRNVSSQVDVFYLISDAEKRGEATEYQLRWKADYLRWEQSPRGGKVGLLKEDPYCLHDPEEGQETPSGLLPLKPNEVVVMQVYVTGGAGAPFEFIPTEPIEEIVLPKSFYKRTIVPVKVQGRSMEKTLRDGAVVGVDRSDRQIVNGELYAVWLPYQGTVIKRLYLDNKKILLQSDNEEFRARDIEVALDEVDEHFIQGRVKWAIQML